MPGGRREGRNWRCGSVGGERGRSLSVDLSSGLWLDHANPSDRGDALHLVQHVLGCSMGEAIEWAEEWLGHRAVGIPQATPMPAATRPATWPRTWSHARPIRSTLAEAYLTARGLAFDDPMGEVLRFDPRRCRIKPDTENVFEHHAALLALVRDVRTGEPCGMHSIFLQPDGSDRLRDSKGKLSTGNIRGGAVMLSDFADVTMGLTIAEGVETAISVLMDDLAPVWALCGAGNLATFPVLGGVEALTIAADTGLAGRTAAWNVTARWRQAGRETCIVAPAHDDWAAGRRISA